MQYLFWKTECKQVIFHLIDICFNNLCTDANAHANTHVGFKLQNFSFPLYRIKNMFVMDLIKVTCA